jgi:hypothetical protein
MDPAGPPPVDRRDRPPARPRPATVKAYVHDPTGEKARAVKARYRGYCRTCGAYTSPRNGKGDAYLYCRVRRPVAAAPS